MLSPEKVVGENISVFSSEVNLGKLEKLYPTIPAMEVTIPHILASFNSVLEKEATVQIKSLRCLAKTLQLRVKTICRNYKAC